ncbi:uncharacterized protein LOC126297893 [Schistocerca gregaria]|uniref:uncharacterized protein LOC126297893 n=1 Tax=Schistocerca gregaria TaxID=7010 RepID=UPI00211F3CE1|nr:uncharacterized protein LOC126297893 [Schistocerca gregaria]XP_049845158.1 uncharacterized protein LOC126297893 [Schistocerca gregaria]XP_049845159.1 uncharacterized protein LOC126297893 [Schistocerca gregaria]
MSQRPKETSDEQRERNRERMRRYRATRTAEQATIDRQRHAQYAKIRRENMSPTSRARMRQRACLRAREKRASLSDRDKAVWRAKNAEYQKLRRSRLSDEERERVRRRNAERTRAKRAINAAQPPVDTDYSSQFASTIVQSDPEKDDMWEQSDFMHPSFAMPTDDFDYFPFNLKTENHDDCEGNQFWNCFGLMRHVNSDDVRVRCEPLPTDSFYYSY